MKALIICVGAVSFLLLLDCHQQIRHLKERLKIAEGRLDAINTGLSSLEKADGERWMDLIDLQLWAIQNGKPNIRK